MIVTFGELRNLVYQYTGKSGNCPDSEETRLFALEVLQRLLYKGVNGNLKKFCLCATNGVFTLPPDLENPLKVKIDGQVESVWSKWYEFYDVQNERECDSWDTGMQQLGQDFYTIYDLPSCGARVAAIASCEEDKDAKFILQGINKQGKVVFIEHQGMNTLGEVLPIGFNNPSYTAETFTSFTNIQKTKTKGYVRLVWLVPETGQQGLLGEYKPTETLFAYKRVKISNCNIPCAKVSILGRIREPQSMEDNEIVPVTNISALKKMAQTIQAEDGDNLQEAQYKEGVVDRVLLDENQYKKSGQENFDFSYETSPGRVQNLQ